MRQIRRKARPLLLPSTPSSSKGVLPDHSFHLSRSLAFRIPHAGPFITPVQPTGSCFQNRVAWSFSQRSPWPEHFHHHLPALGASGIFLTPTDASREPLRVHCLQWHLAKATWMVFYFLRIQLAGSLRPSSFVQHFRKPGTVFEPVNVGVSETHSSSARRGLDSRVQRLNTEAGAGGPSVPPCLPRQRRATAHCEQVQGNWDALWGKGGGSGPRVRHRGGWVACVGAGGVVVPQPGTEKTGQPLGLSSIFGANGGLGGPGQSFRGSPGGLGGGAGCRQAACPPHFLEPGALACPGAQLPSEGKRVWGQPQGQPQAG